MISRRVTGGQNLLTLSPELWNAFVYTLAVSCERYEIKPHVAHIETAKEHLVVTDVRGQLPLFLGYLNRMLSVMIQDITGIKLDAVWEPNRKCDVELLESKEQILDSLASIHANPVRQGMVSGTYKMKSGMASLALRGTYRATKPEGHFRGKQFPERVSLCLSVPSAFIESEATKDSDTRAFIAELKERCHVLEEEARQQMQSQRRTFLGWERMLLVSRGSFAKHLPSGGLIRSAKTACKTRMRKKKAELQRWHAAYRRALAAFRAGDREVMFPVGTWWMVHFHGCRC